MWQICCKSHSRKLFLLLIPNTWKFKTKVNLKQREHSHTSNQDKYLCGPNFELECTPLGGNWSGLLGSGLDRLQWPDVHIESERLETRGPWMQDVNGCRIITWDSELGQTSLLMSRAWKHCDHCPGLWGWGGGKEQSYQAPDLGSRFKLSQS